MLQDRLKNLRKQTGRSQADIASLLNITREAYSMYENGKRQPSYETLTFLADLYNVNTDYLLGRTDNSSPVIDLAEDERFILSAYRKTDEHGRQLFQVLAKFELYRVPGDGKNGNKGKRLK